jgi:hypothetical protein
MLDQVRVGGGSKFGIGGAECGQDGVCIDGGGVGGGGVGDSGVGGRGVSVGVHGVDSRGGALG